MILRKLSLLILVSAPFLLNAQIFPDGLMDSLKNEKDKLFTDKLTNEEVVSGLREALNIGSGNASTDASREDGFYKNELIFIPFPPEAVKVKNTVEKLGMQEQVKQFVLSLNRAAEEASKDAAPIFLNAIMEMTITDGFNILRGADNAATMYLKDKTSAPLFE